MRKANRLFQLVNLIRVHQPITAQQLAERMEVSIRTIYRYMDDLSVSGIPIYGEPGRGYALHDNFELPPLTLNAEELEALMFGVEMLSNATGLELAGAAKTLLSKIEAVSPLKFQQPEALAVRAFGRPFNALQRGYWDELHRAIRNRSPVRLAYLSLDGDESERTVSPLGLFYWGGKWTLGAWCHLRKDYRDFRVDRIRSVRADTETHWPKDIDLAGYLHHQTKGKKIQLEENPN